MKKLSLLSVLTFILFIFPGCTPSPDKTQTREPISVTIQQPGKAREIVKIKDKNELNLISNCVQSIKWTSDDSLPLAQKIDGYIIFQYNAYNKDNKFSEDNPYKAFINGDKSITIESSRGKVGTISKEEANNSSLYKYFETK